METTHPHTFTDFLKYKGTKFAKYVLPIIPANATLTELSKIPPSNLGKIPGKWKGDITGKNEWAGFDSWQTYYAMFPGDIALERWAGWQLKSGAEIALGYNSHVLIGFDGDTDSQKIAEWFRYKIESVTGTPTPMIRRRDGAVRFVMAYCRDEHTAPFSKIRFVSKDAEGATHLLEVLPTGCQWVGEGPHARGDMHYWENEAPVHQMWDDIPTISHDPALRLLEEMKRECGDVGLVWAKASSVTTSSDRASSVPINSLMSPHVEPNRDRLTRAINHIDLDHEEMDYDAFISLQRAICASVAGDLGYMAEVVWPWCCTQKQARGNGDRTEERGIEWLEERWRSFPDSSLSQTHVYWWAARCGYPDAMNEHLGQQAEGLFDAITDGPADTQGAAGSTAGWQGAGGAGNGAGGSRTGSNGPVTPRDTHDQLARDLIPLFRPTWRYCLNSRLWYHYEGGRWRGGFPPSKRGSGRVQRASRHDQSHSQRPKR